MDKEKFEELVEQALAEIPKKFKKRLENLAVIVEEKPSREIFEKRRSAPPLSSILGHYHGVPFKHRGPFYGNVPPDVIVVYKETIERICSTEEEIKKKVREVVVHEIGHYFGLSEKELREIEE
jgi:predicted Zn-dependent protease with MMP-like domain